MSEDINDLIAAEFGSPDAGAVALSACAGHSDRVEALKRRLLQPDVALCVNDKCHVFSWAGDHCEAHGVPTLNLCPSQHEVQRARVGVLGLFQSIFSNITPPSRSADIDIPTAEAAELDDTPPSPAPEEKCVAMLPDHPAVPISPGLYVTFGPLVEDPSHLPAGREVVGPVYMPPEQARRQEEELRSSDLGRWLSLSGDAAGAEAGDTRPVVYVSLGSMVQGWDFASDCLRVLFRALCGKQRSRWRVLTTVSRDLVISLLGAEAETFLNDTDIFFGQWVPQFAVLAHPAVKAFVTHCGANSIHESLYHAVPMVALPFFDDQRYNGPRLVQLGLASASLLKEAGNISEELVVTAVLDILDNKHGIEDKLIQASEEARKADGLSRLLADAVMLIKAGEIRRIH
jgi:hypothetical protein